MATEIVDSNESHTVDYSALERMFPARWWFAYVGRTRQQRNGLTRVKPDRGPRGRCGSVISNVIVGEIDR
jgi:hypothetical protein